MADIITLIVGSVALYVVDRIVRIVAPYLVDLFNAVAPQLLDPNVRELDYLFHYHSNIEKLNEEVNKLQKVSEPIKAAWTNADEIEPDVEEWLTSVDRIIENALKFLEDEKKDNKWCFNGLCSNLKSWNQKSKKAKQTAAEIATKIQKRYQLSSSPPPRKIRITPMEGYEAFESRKPTSKKIMEALRNADVNLIGVYGMGGTGKTVLVKEIARKCEEKKFFDEVIMTVVSQPPSVRKIQGEIADKLKLTLKEETESGRAGRLCEKLKELLMEKKKSILVILDDIWKKLDLAEVGIPFGGKHSGCKIVMTSRNRHVLSNDMDTQEDFGIEVLLEEEAWDLFKKIAGDLIEAPELKPIATEIVEECAGLPLVVKAIANALKNKDSSIWRDALVQLKSSGATNIVGVDPKLYSSLKLSYDFLQNDEARSLFLLCCLFPEDSSISIQDFLRYGKGLGLFQGTLKKSRDRAHALVAHLKGSCLLLDGNTTESVRVHDVVRDVGISIASKDKNMLILRNEDRLEECATEERLRNCPAISLPYSNIQELPKELKCPELKFLLLLSKDHSLAISDNFFEGMKQLKVLDLTNIHFSSLPSSLYLLSNLQTLCLDQCMLRDIARIGELKKLEVLSFVNSDIAELPREIGQLTCLRLLDLRNCFKLKVIPPNVIEKFTQLEDLYMGNSFEGWEVDGNASLAELKDLSLLVTLHIHIPDPNILPKDLRFENLMRYRISIGDGWGWYGDYETSRTLKLKLKTSIEQFGLNSLLEKTEDLYLCEMNGNKNGLCSSNREVFPQLRHLHVEEGCEMEYVVNTLKLFPDKAFPELRSLFLHNLINLKKICHGQLPTESFSNLRIVEVKSCNSLKNLFSLSMVKSLRQLRTLKIEDCKIMDEIVSEGSEASVGNNEAMGKITFPQLRSLKLRTLPKLSSFYSKKQTSRPFNNYAPTTDAGFGEIISEAEHDIPTPLFNEKVAFPNLEELVIHDVDSLKEIWPSQLPVKDDSFCNLKSFRVEFCLHLLNIIPSNMLMRLQNLESLEVSWCNDSVEYIFDVGELNDMERHVPSSIPLRKLSLHGCPRLKQIWKTDSQLRAYFPFQNLTSLKVIGCPDLRHIFTTSIAKSLVQLQELLICSCEMVEEIVGNEGVEEESMGKTEFPRLTSLDLSHLPQLKSFYQGILKVETFSLKSSSVEESHGKGHVGTPMKPLFLVDKVAFPDLEELKLRSMSSMKEIWQDQYHAASFGKLRVLEVRYCESLTHVLTFAIAKSLVQIKSIIVDDCKMMKEVIASEEGKETDETTFNQLNSLKLRNLPNLTSFCARSNTFSFPSLEEVLVEKCTELKNFSDGILHAPKLDKVHVQSKSKDKWREVKVLDKGFWKGDLNTTIQYFFLQKVEFLRLFELFELKQICHDQFPVEACYVRYLVVEKCTSLLNVVSSNMLESLPKLEKITVESCDSLEQVFDLEGLDCDEMIKGLDWDKKRDGLLPYLEEMNLIELPKLRCIWNKDPKGILTFNYLRQLKIHKCNSLRNLFSPSMVPDLRLRDGLEITDCLNMEEIVEKEKGAKEEAIDMIMFCCSSIILQGLPNLTSFYPGNRSLRCLWLNTMKIAGCPRIKTIFTSTNEGLQETFGDGNNDVPSAAFFNNNKVEFPRLKELELEDLYSIKELWQGQLHAESFCELTTLAVRSCQSLTHLLPFEIAKSLVQIKSITVDSCEMMKEIIARKEGEEADHETTFSQLSSLKLRSLSNLTNFCTGSNTLSFPSLEQVLVEECPKLKTFSNGILNTTKLEKVQVQEDEWVWKDDLNTTIQHLFAQKGDHL